MSQKYVYLFSEGNANMRELLGGKGANLAEMTNLGLPIPQGFTVTTEACTRYYEDGEKISPEIEEEIFASLAKLEEITGKKFGDLENPLLVSVRSGARASMPGMMDTVLNLGLNEEVVKSIAQKNERFAYDSYRRFIQMFSDVVMEIPKPFFEKIIDAVKEANGVKLDTELTAEDLKELKQEAMVGFSDALVSYDQNKGVNLPKFISVCVERKVRNYVRKAETVKSRIIKSTYSLDALYGEEDCVPLSARLGSSLSDPQVTLEADENIKDLTESINELLSKSEKEVYELIINDFSYEDIARILNKDIKAIYNTAARLRAKIKSILE